MANSTKQELEEALKKQLLKKPLDKITIHDLTEECGISRMAFYYHFKDIYDLVEWACVEDARRALEAKCQNELNAASNRDNVVMQKRLAITRGGVRPGRYNRVVVPVQKRASMEQTLLPPLKPPPPLPKPSESDEAEVGKGV